ncbi:caspase family protein [Nostoc sp.]|uniref:caspase family protein n=1 Tax=Nostoc sp. TaxID=1180 RepID=UPI002FFD0080
MNIAIVIGISNYFNYSEGQEIIAPQKDASRIDKLLKATQKYQNILYITENTTATSVKDQIRSFLQSYDKQEIEIEEVFYYFSGHGILEDQEFYMLCSDYDKSKKNTTTLQNSEIDSFIRVLEPKLTVKIIDACFSGYRYLKDNSFGYGGNISSEKTLKNVIFMASSHDDQQSQMMGEDSFFTAKFIEGALSVKIGGKVLYRDIQGFIADEFRSMITQRPFFTTQNTGTEVFTEYTEAMQALREEFYPETIGEIENEDLLQQEKDGILGEAKSLDDKVLVDKIDKILAKQDALFVEEGVINTTLEDIKKTLLNYKISDQIVDTFYQINFSWDKKLSDIAKSPKLLRMADIENWSDKYLIKVDRKTETVQQPVSNFSRQLLGFAFFESMGMGEVEKQKPYSLRASHSLPYDVVLIEFQPNNKLSLSPFFGIIALVHSETQILILFHKGIMIKDAWRHFTIDWDSLNWNKQNYRWKDIIQNPTILWEKFLNETIQEIREYLVELT